MPRRRSPRVLLLCGDLQTSDRLVDELLELGMDPVQAFSSSDAIETLTAGSVDAVVMGDMAEDEGLPLLEWQLRRFKGVAVHMGEATEPDEASARVVGGLLTGLANAGRLG